MLVKRGIEVMVGAALMVALLFVVPAVAQAQERQEGAPPASVVVRPGDTLWSISEERLGPNATPQRIAREVERIYALNRHRIGPDPNQIFSGQELSLPPAGGSSSTEEIATKNMAQKTAQEAATGTVGGAARGAKGRPADQQQANHPSLPKAPASAATAAVPAVGSLSTDTRTAAGTLVGVFAEARATADGRRLLGWGIIALTLVVCALMAWKLPMRRSLSDDLEVWGIPSGHQGRPHASLQAYDAWSSGFSANGAASSEGARDVPGMRQTADTEFGGLDASREWEIGEPIRRAVGSMPLVPGPARSRALWEAKPLAQDALATLAFLEQRRRLSSKELRQAGAIRRFLAALEEEEAVYQGSQGTRANGSEANGSEAEATATKNGASRGTRHIETTRRNAGIGGR
jgi:LysM domain